MSADNNSDIPEEFTDLSKDQREALAELAKQHAKPGSVSRRDALKAGSGLGLGALLGGGSVMTAMDQARADASSSDSDGDIGTPSDRNDVFADGVDANSVNLAVQHTGLFAPFYRVDDFGDNAATSGRSGTARTHYLNPTQGTRIAKFRPYWTEQGGSTSVSNQELTVGSSGGYITIPSGLETGSWEVHFKFDTAPASGELQTFLLRKDANNQWRVRIQSGGGLNLSSVQSGTNSTLVSSTWPVDTNPHTVRVERTRDGDWELFFDGASEGTATDTFVPGGDRNFGFYNGMDVATTVQHVALE